MKRMLQIALLSLMSLSAVPVFAQTAAVNINEASVESLATLPGIGAVKAQAIVDDREANGDYQTLDDLTRVDGIGETTVANLSDSATL